MTRDEVGERGIIKRQTKVFVLYFKKKMILSNTIEKKNGMVKFTSKRS